MNILHTNTIRIFYILALSSITQCQFNLKNILFPNEEFIDPDLVIPTLANISYGNGRSDNSNEQLIDLYYPVEIPPEKIIHVIILIHGGGWSLGSKNDAVKHIPFLRDAFPTYLIANMGYRKGSWTSPGFPKQLEDVGSVIKFIKDKHPRQNLRFALFGSSSGAHVAMLYAYRYDRYNKDVAVVIDVLGPSDFTDPVYVYNIFYNAIYYSLVGPHVYGFNPSIYKDTSPVDWITKVTPPTIGIYGDNDPYIPNSQHERLKARLDGNGVPNEMYIYKGGHFTDWAEKDKLDAKSKVVAFVKKYFK